MIWLTVFVIIQCYLTLVCDFDKWFQLLGIGEPYPSSHPHIMGHLDRLVYGHDVNIMKSNYWETRNI